MQHGAGLAGKECGVAWTTLDAPMVQLGKLRLCVGEPGEEGTGGFNMRGVGPIAPAMSIQGLQLKLSVVPDTTFNRVVDTWNGVIEILPGWFSRLKITRVSRSCIESPHDDYLVIFGDFSVVSAGTRFWEFTGVDGYGNESGPLEPSGLDIPPGLRTGGPGVLAYGTNVPSKWPISVHIYERDTNGTRRLLAQVPAKRTKR